MTDGLAVRVAAVRHALAVSAAPIPAPPPGPWASAGLAATIEHTLLKPDATPEDVLRCVEEAKAHRFAGVCVNAWHVERVAEALAGTGIATVAVVGFPLGASLAEVKAAETTRVVAQGALEVDTVLNIGALRAERLAEALADVRAVVDAARGAPVKVILETHLLTEAQRVEACVVAELGGAAFVKTSTGFTGGGATVADVLLMREAVGDRLRVKASGGIRSVEAARAMLDAGAARLGTSASVALVTAGRGEGTAVSGY